LWYKTTLTFSNQETALCAHFPFKKTRQALGP
jgi:hypothetical protein